MHAGPSSARRLWELIEPIHDVTYFSPEPLGALRDAGYKGFWMGYFAGRAAPLGAASAELVHALFFNFAFDRVARALPDAWDHAAPDVALAARLDGSVAALRRHLGDPADDETVQASAELAWKAASTAPMTGRPLFAANRSVAPPDEPLSLLWHAATLLREHRGDGHITALMAAEVPGRAAHVLHSAAVGIPRSLYTVARDFDDDEWATSVDVLHERGYLDADGALTEAGAAVKEDIEHRTDALAAEAYESLSERELDRLVTSLLPITAAVIRSGDLPDPSPVGLRHDDVSRR